MSTEESVYYGVPILVMPGFFDQFSNGARAGRAGYGAVMKWSDLEADTFL
jgi:UDP:flavonoid glycosyltransferase YjiC (YdhE family)